MSENVYYDLVTEAVNTQCYIYEVKRYDPNGGVTSLTNMCAEELYDQLVIEGKKAGKVPDSVFLEGLVNHFLIQLNEEGKDDKQT